MISLRINQVLAARADAASRPSWSGRNTDCDDTRGRFWDGLAIGTQSFNMEGDAFADQLLSLLEGRTRYS
jgi:hypothetical protein